MRSYLEAWKQFVRDTGFTAALIERPVQHPVFKYAGTPDRHGEVRLGRHLGWWVLDIKATRPSPIHGLQLAGYAACLDPVDHRAVVELLPTGQYRLHRYVDHAGDRRAFLAALTLHNWRKKHGLI